MKFTPALVLCVVLAPAFAVLPACKQKTPASVGAGAAGPQAGHGGPVVDLGAATVGPFDVKATRDEGPIVAGKDAPIDVTVTPVADGAAKVAAVRFWIGVESARGSIKARAEVENAAEPDRWHTHAEVPASLPDESRLWVEIEDEGGELWTTSFDLMR